VYGATSVSLQNLVDDVSVIVPALVIIGYILMILYCGLAFFKFDLIQSRSGAGLVGGVLYSFAIISKLDRWEYFLLCWVQLLPLG